MRKPITYRRIHHPHVPTLSSLGGSFVVTYPEADAKTLQEARAYQQILRNAGWLSRLECARPGSGLRLYIFQPNDLPFVAFATTNRYAS